MSLNEYEFMLLKVKLAEFEDKGLISAYGVTEVAKLIDKIEIITTRLVKDFNYKEINFTLCRRNLIMKGFDYYTNITGGINKDGLIDLDSLNIFINTNLNHNHIHINSSDYGSDLFDKYNIKGSGRIYL